MKIGIFLGSFDPIHIGHLAIVSNILNYGICDKILIVVAKQNPWKKHFAANFNHRCKMIESSTKPLGERCEVCTLERDIEPPTYSYKVLDLIRQKYKEDELYIIGGTDTICTMHNWAKFQEKIKPFFKYVEVARDNNEAQTPITMIYRDNIGENVTLLSSLNVNNLSSTMVRTLVKNNKNPYPYVSENILEMVRNIYYV